MQDKFSKGLVKKKYLAIVRGYTDNDGIIDYPLKREDGTLKEAGTHYKTMDRTELDIPFSGQPTSRYSLVEIEPQTGRMHQIRKHFAHIFHPIIGDRPHGCNKQNRLFKEKWNMTSMMLHSSSLSFDHPGNEEKVVIKAKPSIEFFRTYKILDFNSRTLSKLISID